MTGLEHNRTSETAVDPMLVELQWVDVDIACLVISIYWTTIGSRHEPLVRTCAKPLALLKVKPRRDANCRIFCSETEMLPFSNRMLLNRRPELEIRRSNPVLDAREMFRPAKICNRLAAFRIAVLLLSIMTLLVPTVEIEESRTDRSCR
jgi:hypothetical protein